MTVKVGRNDPCPCGSGLKYKQCCQGKMRWHWRSLPRWALFALGLVVIAIVAFGFLRSRSPTGGQVPRGTATSGAGTPSGVAPVPWAYDSVSGRHFDPGHGHWHDGPPPPAEARGATTAPAAPAAPGVVAPGAAGPTPAPWTYDREKNQHWDPAHGHWHPGPPPAGAP